MVIIERLGFVDDKYGYAAFALTAAGPKAVTNLRADCGDPWGWGGQLEPRVLSITLQQAAGTLVELDKACASLPGRLLWFDAVDSPIFVLHDIRPNGDDFSFAVRGVGAITMYWPGPAAKEPLDYKAACDLVNRGEKGEVVPYGSPRAKELQAAGRVYAALLAQVWKSLLTTPDATILGK
ncbi:MAG: hypothetical protein NTU94_07045 [Planctomycetota bacterium]|nr:hypothetical protein [Planctomycetota bacterium]